MAPPVYPMADALEWEPVPWLLRPMLFRGGLTYVTGDPDVGKSTFLCALAASLTTGRSLPWESSGLRAPLKVAWLLYEDSACQTIGPRLEAAGADLSRVKIIPGARANGSSEVEVLSYDDLERLKDDLEGFDVLFCDALNAFLPTGLDMAKGPHVRRLLAGLTAVLDQMGLGALFVRHDRKGGGEKALYRSSGILDWTAAARIEMTMAKVPEAEETQEDRPPYALAYRKNNLVHPDERQSWGYAFDQVEVSVAGALHSMPVLDWQDKLELSAEELVAPPKKAGGRESIDHKVQEALWRVYSGGATTVTHDWVRSQAARCKTNATRIKTAIRPMADEGEDGCWTIRAPT